MDDLRDKTMRGFRSLALLAFSLFWSVSFLAACSSWDKSVEEKKGRVTAEDVKRETGEALETTRAYTLQQRDEFLKEMDVKLKQLDRQIDELKVKAKVARAQSKAELEEQINQLEKERDTARRKLEELRASGAEKWKDLKSQAEIAMNDLENSVKQVTSRPK